jgi:hypothetical protein
MMTHYEDVKRAATPTTIDFLNARVKALEQRVEYLEIQNEWLEQEFNISNLNKKQ